MTALRLQAGGRHHKSPASLQGGDTKSVNCECIDPSQLTYLPHYADGGRAQVRELSTHELFKPAGVRLAIRGVAGRVPDQHFQPAAHGLRHLWDRSTQTNMIVYHQRWIR